MKFVTENLDCSEIIWELLVREANHSEGIPALVADLIMHHVWQPQILSLCNICVIDTDTLSHVNCPFKIALSPAEAEKKTKYSEAYRVSLTPCVRTVDSAFGR